MQNGNQKNASKPIFCLLVIGHADCFLLYFYKCRQYECSRPCGLEVAEELTKLASKSKVIILTTFARPSYFERAAKSNVHGYLLKDGEIDDLADAIRKVNPLTEREQDILRLAASGKTTKEIAAELFLSAGTVRNYISENMHKLGAKNRTEAAKVAKG